MAAFLKFVNHDAVNNTLEATWLEGVFDGNGILIGYQVSKCQNYDATQKLQFLTDLGSAGQKYVAMAGW